MLFKAVVERIGWAQGSRDICNWEDVGCITTYVMFMLSCASGEFVGAVAACCCVL